MCDGCRRKGYIARQEKVREKGDREKKGSLGLMDGASIDHVRLK